MKIKLLGSPCFSTLLKGTVRWYFLLCGFLVLQSCDEEVISCPEVSFTSAKNAGNTAITFIADFPNQFENTFAWYVDGNPEKLKLEGEAVTDIATNIYFTYDQPGEHEICIRTKKNSDCPDGVSYCEIVTLDTAPPCESVFFEVINEQLEKPGEFTFKTNFIGKERTDYAWYVDNELVEQELVGAMETDHILYQNYNTKASREVCIRSITPSCQESTAFCTTVSSFEFCPGATKTLFFEELFDNPDYNYTVTIELAAEISDYQWIIDNSEVSIINGVNGNLTSKITTTNSVTSYAYTVFVFFEPGNHTVFYEFKDSKCPTNVGFGKDINVD